MKRWFIVIALAVCNCGCGNAPQDTGKDELKVVPVVAKDTAAAKVQVPDYLQNWYYPIIKVRDCEYIVVESGVSSRTGYDREIIGHSLIHCADCRNPLHNK